MKYWILLLGLALALTGCTATPADPAAPTAQTTAVSVEPGTLAAAQPVQPATEVLNIREKMFIAEINDIYLNPDEYMSKPIHYEGVFNSETYGDDNLPFYSVIRYGPGCCGNDGNVGFEVVWDKQYPKQDAWVELTGTLERYEEDGETYLRLRASQLSTKAEAGNAYVLQ